MNEHRESDDAPQLEPGLGSAVQAILAEPVPDQLAERVKDWARRLPASLPQESKTSTRHRGRVLPTARWRLVAWSVPAAAAAVALVSFFLLSTSSHLAMAEMFEAVAKRPWIHGTTTHTDGRRTVTSESWLAPTLGLAASKFDGRLQFDDLETGISLKYNAKDGILYRVVSFSVADKGFAEGRLPELLKQLVAGEQGTSELFHGERVVKVEQQEDEQDGKRWVEYFVRLERIGNSEINRTVRIRLDAETQLPELWEERRASGVTAVTRFDYPAAGPSNIYELGVPRTAQLIDRVPRDDLARIIASQRAARKRFDAYDAIVVGHSEGVRTGYEDLRNLNVRRVRREGARYRVDALLAAKDGLAPPTENTDMKQWWQQNRDQYWSVPMLICDGATIHFYDMLDDRIFPGKKPNLSVVPGAKRAVSLPLDDSPVPWPQLMPEQCSHPHLWTTTETRQFDVNAAADDVPAGSVRVIVTRSSGPRAGEMFRYWFDPARDYILQKEVSTVFDAETNKVAYLNTEEFEDFAQSPGGMWFPQRVRRTTSEHAKWTGVTRFYLDFQADLDSELFEPVPDQ